MMVTFMMNDPQKRGSIKRDLRLKLDSWTRYEFFLFILNWLASSLTSVLKHTLFPIVFSHYATKSKSCHHHTNFMIHTSSTCRVEKIRVQPFEIIIFVDTPISFVFKLDKRPLNGQKENEIVILYTLQVQRKKLWHDTTILFFIKDNDSFCIATNISSSRAPSNYRTIIKKRFLHAKTLAAAAACCFYYNDLRARHACVHAPSPWTICKTTFIIISLFFRTYIIDWLGNTTQHNLT